MPIISSLCFKFQDYVHLRPWHTVQVGHTFLQNKQPSWIKRKDGNISEQGELLSIKRTANGGLSAWARVRVLSKDGQK